MANVKRLQGFMKTLYVEVGKNDNYKEVKRFVFHDGEQEIFSIARSYIEYDNQVANAKGNLVSRTFTLESFKLNQVRNARKIDYSKKDNFYYSGLLYIHVGEDVKIESVQKDVERTVGNTIVYDDLYNMSFNCGEFTVSGIVKVFKRSEVSEKGKQLKKIGDAFREKYGINPTNYQLEKMMQDGVINLDALL
jgi:hypothetical protein